MFTYTNIIGIIKCMSDVKFNFKIPHSKDESIPRILDQWFNGVELTEDMLVKITVEQLMQMLSQAHEEGRIRQMEIVSNNKGLPPMR